MANDGWRCVDCGKQSTIYYEVPGEGRRCYECYGQREGRKTTVNAPLTPEQLRQMIAARNVRYCCWVCHKSMSAAEATAATLWNGSRVYYCAKDYVARNDGIEDPSRPLGMGRAVPQPFTAARLDEGENTRCVDCGGDFDETGRWTHPDHPDIHCQACHKRHVTERETATRSSVPKPPEPAPVNVLEQTYCENAPPRGVVEGTSVMLDGDEVGGVPKTPHLRGHLHWNLRMKAEWERHEAWSRPIVEAAEAAYQCGDVTALMAAETCRPDREGTAPTDTDQFGGRIAGVNGMRCKLCGGWIRIVKDR